MGLRINTGGSKEFYYPTDKKHKDSNQGLDKTAQIRDSWENKLKQKKIITFIIIAIIIYIILKNIR